MAIGIATPEGRAVSGPQCFFARVRDERQFSIEHTDELVLMAVSMTLAGPSTRLDDTGADLLKEYRSSPTTTRSFCSQCGSQLFWQKNDEGWVAVSLGTLDTPFEPRKQRHIHVGSKATWFAIHEKWPQSEKL
jgi:hypothetical protein